MKAVGKEASGPLTKARKRILINIRNTQKVYIPWEEMQFLNVTAGGITVTRYLTL
jgi:hypothetical protein